MNSLAKTVFKNLLCIHNVAYTDKQGNVLSRSIVFMNEEADSYIWVTSSTTKLNFVEGQFYDILAECNSQKVLRQVRILKDYTKAALTTSVAAKSKTKTTNPVNVVDVFDLIFDTDDKHLTND